MRRLRRQAKDRKRAAIPADLLSYLRDVNELVVKRDELATTESDDLLQCESAYGGLTEEGGDRYEFSYFPEETTRHKWIFELSASEIQEISEAGAGFLDLWFCRATDCRCAFGDAEEPCFHCDYEDEGTG